MIEPLTIILDMEPPTCTHQAKQIVRVGAFCPVCRQKEDAILADSENLLESRRKYSLAFIRADLRPMNPFDGAISLKICFCFSGSMLPMWKVTRPDLDNLTKQLQDELVTRKYVIMDQRICRLEVEKMNGPRGLIRIDIKSLANTAPPSFDEMLALLAKQKQRN